MSILAPRVRLASEVLVPDFEISGDEAASQHSFRSQLVARLATLRLDELSLASSRESRLPICEQRLRKTVSKEHQRADAATGFSRRSINRETEGLPERVLDSMLGSSQILDTGVRMRLRSRLVGDTYLLWFPYRTLMSILNMTQGAWDRGRVGTGWKCAQLSLGRSQRGPATFAKAASFNSEIEDGIRLRMQRQVEERLKPLCDQFHRAIWQLRSRDQRQDSVPEIGSMNLSGIEELQAESRAIFERAISVNATPPWLTQLLAVAGTALFWSFMAGPIVSIYHQYFSASYESLVAGQIHPEGFPHPHQV